MEGRREHKAPAVEITGILKVIVGIEGLDGLFLLQSNSATV
jgi:hypothetical protein